MNNILQLLSSIICIIVACISYMFLFFFEKKDRIVKDKINDIPNYKKQNNFIGGHESNYSPLDDAFFHYSIDKMKHTFTGSKEKKIIKNRIKKKETIEEPKFIQSKKGEIHSWYNFNSWNDLGNNSIEWQNYVNDRYNARKEFLFNWDKVFDKVMPLVNNDNFEHIGVIRAEPDKKTLYVHSMERSSILGSTGTYAAGVPYELVKKYASIPSYFIFHTHPTPNCDPLPSDADIYTCLLQCYNHEFVGNVVIGKYGAIIYFLNFDRYDQLITGGLLKYLTYSYDVISAWNALTNSSGPFNPKDRINFLEKWGFEMIIIPSSKYISDSYNKVFLPRVLCDKFIHTKYELLDYIKNYIKKLETEEEKKNKKK